MWPFIYDFRCESRTFGKNTFSLTFIQRAFVKKKNGKEAAKSTEFFMRVAGYFSFLNEDEFTDLKGQEDGKTKTAE
jgi:hypothetical protein